MQVTQALNPKPKVKAWLVIHTGSQDGVVYMLRLTSLTVGKDPQADFVLSDQTISRKHFRLRIEGNRYVITDLDSLNGTTINNKSIKQAYLQDNDVIRIGNTILIYKYVPDNLV